MNGVENIKKIQKKLRQIEKSESNIRFSFWTNQSLVTEMFQSVPVYFFPIIIDSVKKSDMLDIFIHNNLISIPLDEIKKRQLSATEKKQIKNSIYLISKKSFPFSRKYDIMHKNKGREL